MLKIDRWDVDVFIMKVFRLNIFRKFRITRKISKFKVIYRSTRSWKKLRHMKKK